MAEYTELALWLALIVIVTGQGCVCAAIIVLAWLLKNRDQALKDVMKESRLAHAARHDAIAARIQSQAERHNASPTNAANSVLNELERARAVRKRLEEQANAPGKRPMFRRRIGAVDHVRNVTETPDGEGQGNKEGGNSGETALPEVRA